MPEYIGIRHRLLHRVTFTVCGGLATRWDKGVLGKPVYSET
ncbi:MAG: hypothetical protein QXO32_02720 [Candidatus Bathyarchaeia archaeon]